MAVQTDTNSDKKDNELYPAIPAATLVVFRRAEDGGSPELLMQVRSKTMSFVGGAAVFPGGKVDPKDRELAAKLNCFEDEDEAAHRIAAIRETLEETGLAVGLGQPVSADEAKQAQHLLHSGSSLAEVLERFGWELACDTLVPFARWRPNFKDARRFDTRFYLVDLGTGAVDIAVDGTENTHLFWTSAANAIEMAEAGEIKVIFPTHRNLERLALFNSFEEARKHAQSIPIRLITPFITLDDGVKYLCIPDDHGYPVCSARLADQTRT